MRAVRRFLTWLADSLPIYSNRHVAREWEKGRVFGQRQTGVVRASNGRFQKVAP